MRYAQLHRNFGKLHTAQNKLDEALDDLSKDVYCSSLEVGPEHIDTSAGYFLIANIFYAQRKVRYTTERSRRSGKQRTSWSEWWGVAPAPVELSMFLPFDALLGHISHGSSVAASSAEWLVDSLTGELADARELIDTAAKT